MRLRSAVDLDLAQLLPDLCLWKSIVGEQVEESILLRLQFLELAADCCVQVGDALLFVGQRIVEELADVVDKFVGRFSVA